MGYGLWFGITLIESSCSQFWGAEGFLGLWRGYPFLILGSGDLSGKTRDPDAWSGDWGQPVDPFANPYSLPREMFRSW